MNRMNQIIGYAREVCFFRIVRLLSNTHDGSVGKSEASEFLLFENAVLCLYYTINNNIQDETFCI